MAQEDITRPNTVEQFFEPRAKVGVATDTKDLLVARFNELAEVAAVERSERSPVPAPEAAPSTGATSTSIPATRWRSPASPSRRPPWAISKEPSGKRASPWRGPPTSRKRAVRSLAPSPRAASSARLPRSRAPARSRIAPGHLLCSGKRHLDSPGDRARRRS
jgi:hypothetical protein